MSDTIEQLRAQLAEAQADAAHDAATIATLHLTIGTTRTSAQGYADQVARMRGERDHARLAQAAAEIEAHALRIQLSVTCRERDRARGRRGVAA